MAHLTGIKGQIDAGDATQTPVKGTMSWTVDTEGDTVEVTDYTSDGEKYFIAGNIGWSGTFEFNFDTTQNPITDPPKLIEGAEITIKLYLDDIGPPAKYVSGIAIITGVSITVPQPDIVTFTVTFQGKGTLAKVFS